MYTAGMQTRFPPFCSWYSAPAFPPTLKKTYLILHTHAVVYESLRRPLSKTEKRAAREMETNWAAGGWTAQSSWLRLAVTSPWLHPFSFTRTGFPPVLLSSLLFPVEVDLASSPPARAIPRTRHSSRQIQYELKTKNFWFTCQPLTSRWMKKARRRKVVMKNISIMG